MATHHIDPIAPHTAPHYSWRERIGVPIVAMRCFSEWFVRRVWRRTLKHSEPVLKGLEIKTPASLVACSKEWLAELDDVPERVTRSEALDALGRTMNIMTRAALKSPNLKNYKANRSMLKRSRGIGGFIDWKRGMPFFLVGAGPSLSSNVTELKRAKDNGWPILAVDAALPILARAGIEPDIVMMVDTKAWQTKFFDSVKLDTSTVMLAVSCAHPDAIAAWPGEIRFFNSCGGLDSQLIQLWNGRDFGSVIVGGNVSTGLLTFATAFCGAGTIVFVGQDFSYPSFEKYYADGGIREVRPVSKDRYPTWDIYGETVYTDLSLFGYKYWSEMWCKQINEIGPKLRYTPRFVNATEGGILGTEDEPYKLMPEFEQKRLSDIIDELTGAQAVVPVSNTPDTGAEQTLAAALA